MTPSYLPIVSIAAAAALSLLGDAALYTVLPSYHIHIGLTPLQVGILLSVHRWVHLISNRQAERCYRTFPIIFSLAPAFLLASLVTASYGYFNIFIILLVARILWGACFSFIRQAMILTVTAASNDTHLGKSMGLNRGISMTGCVLIVFLCDALLGILVAAWAGQQGGRSVADYATGMDFGMALGPLIGWGIAHFGLPSFLIFLAGAVFYIVGGVVTKPRLRSI